MNTDDNNALKRKILIGIDTGVNTGFAVAYDLLDGKGGTLKDVSTLTITEAMRRVLKCVEKWGKDRVCLYIEDARLRTSGFAHMDQQQAKSGAGVREGVGSVKRDASIWEDWCKEEGLIYKMIHPAANSTKYKAPIFKKLTGWIKPTNEHGRDAAMLVHQRSAKF